MRPIDRTVCERTPWFRELYPSDMPDTTAGSHLFAPERVVRVHPPAPPLVRNERIVLACDRIVACPRGAEELRSGTWATVRKAREHGKHTLIIWPDGTRSNDCFG